MEQVLQSVIAQWGVFGVVLVAAGYIIYDNIKNSSKKTNISNKLENISDDLLNLKTDLPTVQSKLEYVEKKISLISNNFEDKLKLHVDNLSTRIDDLEDKVNEQPNNIISSLNKRDNEIVKRHNEQMLSRITLAPKIYKSMNDYIDRIGCNHIFIGLFHNGTSSISGVPFYKFDIIAEKFDPTKIKHDVEFAHMYKDIDILRHGNLPIELVQNNSLYYVIDADKKSDLEDIDEILYHRMCGRDIKQLAIHLLRDDNGIPLGFVGCIKYDYINLDLQELKKCAKELENIYIDN